MKAIKNDMVVVNLTKEMALNRVVRKGFM